MNVTHRLRQQDGFTLLEVLTVVVVLGILAAFTYTLFVGQDRSAMDANAKSNARSLLWKVQTCFTATEDYTLCDEPTEQEPPPGVTWGDGPGEVQVLRGAATTKYKVTIQAQSQATTDDRHHIYTIVKEPGEDDIRACQSDSGNNAGGCSGGVW
jgi:type IV pilus assembly protein PilA